ncbi:uncharacterized protein BEWA_029760 [Theileria equi strain WA]|uniref:Membrane protein, putative n=1 Tax=Theileria equi strain WA TaxID=1537102 RepID=L0AX38_THEEQ|nr:uncharacterized protein BEWA_029760 [Theileria equi strain WA]AFZ80125.1 membrane protein, putative [Theileria equi strain WA]|eukprot:XP_004829791.1 uncharacterized protein BEWA_029760 [Theileria equi strain WA]
MKRKFTGEAQCAGITTNSRLTCATVVLFLLFLAHFSLEEFYNGRGSKMTGFLSQNVTGTILAVFIVLAAYFVGEGYVFRVYKGSFVDGRGLVTQVKHPVGYSWRDTRPFVLQSRLSIETVIHTDDCENYDVNSVIYHNIDHWRQKTNLELEEVCLCLERSEMSRRMSLSDYPTIGRMKSSSYQ